MIRFDYDSLGCSLLVIGLVMQYEYSVASDRENEEAVCVFHFFTSFIIDPNLRHPTNDYAA